MYAREASHIYADRANSDSANSIARSLVVRSPDIRLMSITILAGWLAGFVGGRRSQSLKPMKPSRMELELEWVCV